MGKKFNASMKILGIDQSTVASGYAVLEGADLAKFGVIDLHKMKKLDARVQQMYRELDALILQVNPDIVVFEDVSLRTNVKTLVLLSRLQGSIQQSSMLRGIPIEIYAPSTWRSIIGLVQGREIQRPQLKQEAIDFVNQSYGITVDDDCAEAICIGLAYLKNTGRLPDQNEKKGKSNNGKKGKIDVCNSGNETLEGK